jgi:protein-disulfide isomerase/uncharacterized membrane protein
MEANSSSEAYENAGEREGSGAGPGISVNGRPYFCGSLPFVLILLATLVGAFATGFLTYRHIVLTSQSSGVGQSLLCPADGRISCDAVLLTEYAVLFDYVSSGALGLMGSVFALWCAIAGLVIQRLRKLAWAVLVLYYFAAVGFSWYFLYLMMYKVTSICPWCIVVHVVNFFSVIVVIVVSIAKKQEFLLPEIATKGERTFFILGGIFLSLAVFFASGMWEKELSFQEAKGKYEEMANDPIVILAMLKASASHDIPIKPDDPVFGSKSAPFPIILFSDFQCPICREKEEFLRGVVRRNPKILRLVYKAFPLSTGCNEELVQNLHPMACEAARAAYAAYFTGGDRAFLKYGHLLFEHQRELYSRPWLGFAKQIGLNTRKFEELLKTGSRADEKIKRDLKLGRTLGLRGTPSVFFQKKLLPSNFEGAYFVKVLEDLIRLYSPGRNDLRLNLP